MSLVVLWITIMVASAAVSGGGAVPTVSRHDELIWTPARGHFDLRRSPGGVNDDVSWDGHTFTGSHLVDTGVEYLSSGLWTGLQDVWEDGDYAYCSFVNGLVILDISDPTAPFQVSTMYFQGRGERLYKRGPWVYLADGPLGLIVIDVFDPATPFVWSSYKTPGYAHDVFVRNKLAYVADSDSGLCILDLTNPTDPLLGTYDTTGEPEAVFVQDTLAYVAAGSGGIWIVSISDPTSPYLVSYYHEADHYPHDIVVRDTLAYVATDGGFWVMDVSPPDSPTVICRRDTNGQAWGIVLQDDLAYVTYVGSGVHGFHIIDVSDPLACEAIGNYQTQRGAMGIDVEDTLAYVCDDHDGLDIVDVSPPEQPIRIGSYATFDRILDVFVDDTLAYVALGRHGLGIVDISEPSQLIKVGYHEMSGMLANSVFVQDTLAFLVEQKGTIEGEFGNLWLFDISDPAAPESLGTYATDPCFAVDVYIHGGLAYIARQNCGLLIVNVASTPPDYVGAYDTPGQAWAVYVLDTLAYVADDFGGGLQILSVAVPSNPYLVGSYVSPGRGAMDVFVDSTCDIAYVGFAGVPGVTADGVDIVNVSDPANPDSLGTFETAGPVYGVNAVNTLVYAAVYDGGLQVASAANPTSPYLVASYDSPGLSRHVFVKDTVACLADGYSLVVFGTAAHGQAPQVVAVSPHQNMLNVTPNEVIEVTFNTDMNAESFDSATFVVWGRSTGLHQGEFDYNAPTRTVTLDPDDTFDAGEVVNVTITTGVKSAQGVHLGSSYSWCFTTVAGVGTDDFPQFAAHPVGSFPSCVIACDLDNDNDNDLAVTSDFPDKVTVLKNNGKGVFALDTTYSVTESPWWVSAGDFDGNGHLDLATACLSDSVSVLLSEGDGTFAASVSYQVGDCPLSVFVADLDGNGSPDLATANNQSNDVSVLLNNGDGSFAAQSVYPVCYHPLDVCAADLDGDGHFDLIAASGEMDSVSVLVNLGNGAFATYVTYQAGDCPTPVVATDFDEDSLADVATANSVSDDISVLLGNGDGSLGAHSDYPVGDSTWPKSIFAADVDGDGHLDLISGNTTSNSISVLTGNGDGSFVSPSAYPVGLGPISVFASDLDQDYDLDLAVVNQLGNTVMVLLNGGCCIPPIRGNVDYDPGDAVDISDLVYLVDYMFTGGPPPPCFEEADMDCSGGIDISDLVYLVDYMFNNGPPPCRCDCADCP